MKTMVTRSLWRGPLWSSACVILGRARRGSPSPPQRPTAGLPVIVGLLSNLGGSETRAPLKAPQDHATAFSSRRRRDIRVGHSNP
jgi:hypothetical protein